MPFCGVRLFQAGGLRHRRGELAHANDAGALAFHPCQRQLDPDLACSLVLVAWYQGQPSCRA